MTQILVVNDWFANRLIQKTIQTFTIKNIGLEKDIEFEIMALNKAMIDEVKSCDSYKEMLFLAADNGLAFDGIRAMDSEEITIDDIEALWGDELKDVDCDPCIRARVGEKVCEISGLAEHLEEMLFLEAELAKEEEAAKLDAIDGDKLAGLPKDLMIDEMNKTEEVYESLAEEAVANANY